MFGFMWVKMWLFVMLLPLQFAAVTGESPRIVVRVGDDVTLPCANVTLHQDTCDRVNWLFVNSEVTRTKQLSVNRQIHADAGAERNRLSVTDDCSLVINTVTARDAGRYTCRQSDRGDSNVYLFVVEMIEDKINDVLTLWCILRKYGVCGYRVQWLHEDEKMDEGEDSNKPRCSHPVPAPSLEQRSKFTCQVTRLRDNGVRRFPLIRQISGTATTTIMTSTAGSNKKKDGDEDDDKNENDDKDEDNLTPSTQTPRAADDAWMYIVAGVGAAALVVIVVAVITCRRRKGKKTSKDESTAVTLNPVVAESAQDTEDPEDGVSYASVSYVKKTTNQAQVKVNTDDGDDEGDTVTYSTVKASAFPAGASDNSATMYATIVKPNK